VLIGVNRWLIGVLIGVLTGVMICVEGVKRGYIYIYNSTLTSHCLSARKEDTVRMGLRKEIFSSDWGWV
jgi:hypothetical protein